MRSDTEMFYWTGGADKIPESFNDDNDLWVEIWNDVFMQYNKGEDGKYCPLKQKNVDTGMGLERMAMVMQGKNNVYETDLFQPLVVKIKSLPRRQAGKISNLSADRQDLKTVEEKSIRIIADHIKASVFIIGDEVAPSNIGRGYVFKKAFKKGGQARKVIRDRRKLSGRNSRAGF